PRSERLADDDQGLPTAVIVWVFDQGPGDWQKFGGRNAPADLPQHKRQAEQPLARVSVSHQRRKLVACDSNECRFGPLERLGNPGRPHELTCVRKRPENARSVQSVPFTSRALSYPSRKPSQFLEHV